MIFRVGQRVKMIRTTEPRDVIAMSERRVRVGSEGTVIMRHPGWHDGIYVIFDGRPSEHETGAFRCMAYQLAPLTDPLEEAWAADKVKELLKPKPLELDELPTMREVVEFYQCTRQRTV